MIRKYFIVGKQVYIQSKKLEGFEDLGHIIELEIPVDILWKMEDVLKEANYVRASGGSQAEVFEKYRELFALCAPYAILEKERKWLFDRSNDVKRSS